MKTKNKRRWFAFWFRPGETFWLARCNAVWFRGAVRCFEITLGLVGFGVLIQFYYGKDRTK